MSNHFEIQAERRTATGKAASRRFRRLEDKVPGVIYGAGKAPENLLIDHNHLFHRLKNESVYSHILQLHIDGKPEQVVLKALQRHPYKPKILHIDFLRISATEKLTMHIPLHFLGEAIAPGVKLRSGVISHHLIDLEIVCLPANLPDHIDVDISKLDLNQAIHIQDIVLPKGVELAPSLQGADHNYPVVSIHAAHVASDEPSGAPEQPTAPEAIAQTKPEE